MVKTYTYEPIKFFSLTFIMSWICWGLAIYVSWQPSMQHLLLPFILGGISAPAIATFIMLIASKSKELWHDFFERLRPATITKRFIPIVLFLFPLQIVLAIVFSVFFGQSLEQLSIMTKFSDQALQGISFLMTVFVIFLVGPFEELGWRGYGIDSLNTKFNLLKTSLIFGVLWGLWHFPLFFIKNGAFQQEIWSVGLLHTAIYFIDLILIAIITNWLYIKNKRSILIAIIFHSIYDVCISIFHITPVTWIILTLILLITSIIIVKKDKALFLKKF